MQIAPGLFASFMSWLWCASLQASVTILLVLLAQWLLRGYLRARWRHALWLLVLIRLVLPWSFESKLSVFNWLNPLWLSSRPAALASNPAPAEAAVASEESAPTATFQPPSPSPFQTRLQQALALLWLTGVLALPACLFFGLWRLGRSIRRQRPVTDGAILDLLEDCKQTMKVRTPLSLVETPHTRCPALFGFIRPRLLLPPGLLGRFSPAELRHVFLHELAHVKRGDIILNWLTTAPLILHWFNPLAWLAVSRMRADGELACDALALSYTTSERKSYGETILKLVENFSRPAPVPALAGILESKTQMKTRIQMITSFRNHQGLPVLAMLAFTALGLLTLTDACTTAPHPKPANGSLANSGPPGIVATSPAMAAPDVDPALAELTVTFDRDMADGFSWTGGGPDFPPGRGDQKPHWLNKRTCVLPVTLEASKYYRVGINSKSFLNFRSTEGTPAAPTALYFTTRGASEDLKTKLVKPRIVSLSPNNGATEVDPAITELRVAFNMEMGGGFSWCGSAPDFPPNPEGKTPFWTDSNRTCVLPVQLKPGTTYSLGLNCPSAINFQSAGGVPLEPVSYSFRTKN
jgi:bla regulator protein BlaR1